MNQTLARILSWFVTLAVPFFLIMTAIRLLFTPVFPQIIYRMPGFPPDYYGFSLEDRLHWSRVSLEYLLNDEGIDFLANQQLPDGMPLYNERELSHMLDVKILLQKMITAWTILLAVLVLLGLWTWRGRWLTAFLNGLSRGGKLTIAIVLFILVGVAVSFRAFFTSFHEIFFTGNSWLFNFSDSLIRLFPLPLWEYGFIMMGLFTLLFSALLIWINRWYTRRYSVNI